VGRRMRVAKVHDPRRFNPAARTNLRKGRKEIAERGSIGQRTRRRSFPGPRFLRKGQHDQQNKAAGEAER
ncbi:MAG TPA: hypothetical protein VE961_22615, partial [Pyrinomonadaceae bacterium]|nr:hypothetical protein [Pyrinomonadaceae bacterium]